MTGRQTSSGLRNALNGVGAVRAVAAWIEAAGVAWH